MLNRKYAKYKNKYILAKNNLIGGGNLVFDGKKNYASPKRMENT